MTVLHFHSVAAKPQDAYNLLDLKHDWFDKVSQLSLLYHRRELYFTLVQHTCMYKILQYFVGKNISKCFTFQQTTETFCKCSFDEQTNKQPDILCHVGTSVVLVFSIMQLFIGTDQTVLFHYSLKMLFDSPHF